MTVQNPILGRPNPSPFDMLSGISAMPFLRVKILKPYRMAMLTKKNAVRFTRTAPPLVTIMAMNSGKWNRSPINAKLCITTAAHHMYAHHVCICTSHFHTPFFNTYKIYMFDMNNIVSYFVCQEKNNNLYMLSML